VAVTPDQLRGLSGIEPDERRSLTPRGETEPFFVTGDDVVRLQISPDPTFHISGDPWGKLYTLHWNSWVSITPTVAPDEPDYGPVRVPVTDVTGGTLEQIHPDGGKTAVLVGAVVVGTLLVGAIVFLAVGFSETRRTVNLAAQ
jgi:hypothetical protein